MNFREQRKSKIFVLSVIFLTLIGSVLYFVCGKLLYCNMTDSAVRGLYAAAPNQNLARGDYVIVRLPEGIESLHVDAGFRLLKRVRGFPGESYTVDEEYLRTHDDSYRIYHKDGLPQLEAGTYTIPDGTLLLLNDTDDSFDSRYLGAIESSQIDKKVFLLLSYEPFLKLIGRGKI
ncbi:hypothetical protein AXF19_05000 [Selenomonas sp. oral taxon 126]|uniref:S26 family signal peptidase n=1 Tax=Selenomonas sp. oral taxon 126 TaxID=712528 RepID=UPI00080797A5|nr:S26 family signal peptidase [Selenomonas sp. oral taxon 126]ANR70396.1 hypothetical protein AXF19_05000 [Selenomonas sp. oral taxon 126]